MKGCRDGLPCTKWMCKQCRDDKSEGRYTRPLPCIFVTLEYKLVKLILSRGMGYTRGHGPI